MSPRGLFVVGTDTEVGKTRVAVAIVRALKARGRTVGALKPVASSAVAQADGTLASPDVLALRAALGAGVPCDRVGPIQLPGDLAPSVAARAVGSPLDREGVLAKLGDALAWWADRCEVLVVEGVGGLLCPVADGATVADLATSLDFPLVVVARRGLGTLNHTLLTVEAARLRGLRVAGVILNGAAPATNPEAEATNPAELSRWLGDVPLLADCPHEPAAPMSAAMHDVDWWERASPGRWAPGVGPAPAG